MSLHDQLYELFIVDQNLRGLRTRLDAALRREKLQAEKLGRLNQQAAELGEQRKTVGAKASSLEHEADDAEKKIASHREQMNTITNNKEYSALLVEMDTLKELKSKLDTEALEFMTKAEEIEAQFKAVSDKIANQEKLLAGAAQEVKDSREEVGGKLDELEAERKTVAANVPNPVLSVYDRAGQQHEGESLSIVELQDKRRREYICGGCYMQLPIERVNALMTRTNEMFTCPSCDRILFMKEELRTAIGVK